jgi:hypothetical protein
MSAFVVTFTYEDGSEEKILSDAFLTILFHHIKMRWEHPTRRWKSVAIHYREKI